MQILTVKEVCKIMRISTETLRKWRKCGNFPSPLPANKEKCKLLWDLQTIEKWLHSNQE